MIMNNKYHVRNEEDDGKDGHGAVLFIVERALQVGVRSEILPATTKLTNEKERRRRNKGGRGEEDERE